MAGSTDGTRALRLLRGLEQGGLAASDARALAEELDPVLVHLIVRYLREAYPASDPAATPVLERVVALTRAWPGIVAVSLEGEEDPVTAWFVEQHALREFRGRDRELIETVRDKLES